MADEIFNYSTMVEDALRGVVKRALEQAEKHGLPGNHHFYITFRTGAPGVQVPPYLAEKYPDEMTIVLQYQFWNLEIYPDRFEVTLSFNDVHERLIVPFITITSFADPSEKFGLQFQGQGQAITSPAEAPDEEGTLDDVVSSEAVMAVDGTGSAKDPDGEASEAAEDAPPETGRIVSLDQFRKKK